MSSTAQTKISVLIPAYNKERGIVRAVQSVTAQTWKNLEVIVLDDASTDRTAEQVEALCRQDARVRLVRREQNGGTLNARLDAFAASTGDYLLCLDADDTLDPACAETLLKIAERSHAEIVGFSARLLDHGKTAGTVDAVRKELNGKAVFEAAFCDHLYNWSVCLKFLTNFDFYACVKTVAWNFYDIFRSVFAITVFWFNYCGKFVAFFAVFKFTFHSRNKHSYAVQIFKSFFSCRRIDYVSIVVFESVMDFYHFILFDFHDFSLKDYFLWVLIIQKI